MRGDVSRPRLAEFSRELARACAAAMIAVGAVAVSGWAFDLPLVARLWLGSAAMAPNSAVAFGIMGIGLFLLAGRDPPHGRRIAAGAAGFAVALLGVLTIVEYVSGRSLGVDQIISTDARGAVVSAAPGRMAEATAVNFFLLGSAMTLMAARRDRRIVQALCFCALIVSLVGAAGYLYDVQALYAIGPFTGIALPTVVTFLVAGVGCLAADPDHGVAGLLASTTIAGLMTRRVLPFAVALPLCLGWLEVRGARAGLYRGDFGDALFVVASVVLMSALIVWQGAALARVDRARFEAAGAASQALDLTRKLTRAVEQSPVSIVITDADGNIEYVNPKFSKVTGYSAAEVLGMNPRILKSGELSRDVYRGLWETITEGREWHGEFHNRKKDGSLYWEFASISPIFDERRRITHFVAVEEDITARKQAEETLRFKNLLLGTLSEVSPNGILVVDAHDRIIHVNSRFLEMMGIREDQVSAGDDAPVLKTVAAMTADPVSFLARIRYLYEHPGETGRDELAFKDGRTIERHSSPMLGTDGHNYGRVWYFRDVSERRTAQDELAGRERHFRSLIENAQDVITILDSEGTIRFQSPSAERLLGRHPGDFVGKSVLDFLHPDDVAGARAGIRRAIECQPPLILPFRLRHANGSWRMMEGIGKLLPGDGIPQIVVNSRDVTERHALEEQFRQAQKMEAVGRLAGGVAHDFNNLLTVITGYAELASARLKPEDPFGDELHEIEKAAKRAAILTRQLLAFSRMQVLEPRVINLNNVVGEMDRMLQRLIGEDVELVTVLKEDLGSVKADEGQIEQVLMNLAINSRDAMPGGGKMTIETSEIELDQGYAALHLDVVPGVYVMLAVSDTGSGMDEKTLSQVFEPFFTTKGPGKGTGLGLSMVYGIVKQSGGNIMVYSVPGAGTTFKIYLPRVEDALEGLRPSSARTRKVGGTETILVVEDDESVRVFARQALETHGYAVLSAHGADEALSICAKHDATIHLMLTDVVMPQVSGRELALRASSLRPHMRVLFMSGYTDSAIVHHGVLDADTSFLQKPFTARSLAQKVREVLDTGEPART